MCSWQTYTRQKKDLWQVQQVEKQTVIDQACGISVQRMW